MVIMAQQPHNRPKASICDCPDNFHERDCLFYDPYVDDPILRKYAEDYGLSRDDLGFLLPEDEQEDPTDATEYVCSDGSVISIPNLPGTGTGASTAGSTWKVYSHCKHYLTPYILPGSRMVYASGWSATPIHRHEDDVPDVGCYMDKCWIPADNFAYVVSWEDFSVPTISDKDVIRTARLLIDHIDAGEMVEVGCMGGHGRTGSMLAILALVADPRLSAKSVIDNVRDNYCYEAIENKRQESYIRRISGILKRGEA